MGDAIGLHLLPHIDLVATPRRSVIARLDPGGGLVSLETAADDGAILDRIGRHGAGPTVVDAPLEVPNAEGRRDVEAVLAWCDIAAFPVSRRRLEVVFGGARGVDLAPALSEGGRRAVEALPDQVLRQLIWEARHPRDAAPIALADYRAAWLGVRAPRYRPKGAGRARTQGILEAWRLLADVIDMDGWAPEATPVDDWSAINDAARIDALCCAYAGLRLADPRTGLVLGAPGLGQVALPADANLRERLSATLDRLRDEGAIAI